MRKVLLKIIDFFYPPFSRWFPLHTFRYMVSGGTNAASGIILYYVIYHFLLDKQDVYLPFRPGMITGPVAAFIIEAPLTFVIGFTLNKYLIFTQSELKGRIQMFRYGIVVISNLFLNYAFLKLLVETFNFYPTISKVFVTLLLALASYFMQTHFSFKVKK